MTDPVPILMPRINANEESGIVTRWFVASGSHVHCGTVVAQVETTKAAVDIETPTDGYLWILAQAGTVTAVGAPIAQLTARKEEKHPDPPPRSPSERQDAAAHPERPLSRQARDLLQEENLSIADIPGDGPITADDVLRLLGRASAAAERDRLAGIAVEERSLLLFGAAEQGSVIIDSLLSDRSWVPLAFVDDRPGAPEHENLPVFSADCLPELRHRGVRYAHICIGEPGAKSRIAERLTRLGFEIVSIIHPRAMISASARLGSGVFIGPGVVIGPHAQIGDFCQINNNATLPHHVRLGCGVRIADGAHVAGGVEIGDRSYLGLGVTVNTGCRIGRDATVVSGVSVFDDVADGAIVRTRQIRL